MSIRDQQKGGLIARSTCLLYTPSNEHFGITPLEAMYLSRPVIAVRAAIPLWPSHYDWHYLQSLFHFFRCLVDRALSTLGVY